MKINVKGDIISNDYKWIYDYFEWESCCPKDIQTAITNASDNEDIDVEINSGGGEIFAASEIYSALRSYGKGKVNINITGLAASAASVIAMSAANGRGKSVMSPTALMMVHNVSGYCGGDYRDMEQMADTLKSANEAMANAYIGKSGMQMDAVLKLMDNETWLTAEKAKEYGLIDEIAFAETPLQLMNSQHGIKPEIVDRLRNLINKPNEILKATAELELIKIKLED